MPNPLLTATNRILPALVTPLLPDGKLDEKSAERLVNHLYDQGVGGLYVTGSGFRGVGIPDCIADARATAGKISQWLQEHSAR